MSQAFPNPLTIKKLYSRLGRDTIRWHVDRCFTGDMQAFIVLESAICALLNPKSIALIQHRL
jgi:hypothetical protein